MNLSDSFPNLSFILVPFFKKYSPCALTGTPQIWPQPPILNIFAENFWVGRICWILVLTNSKIPLNVFQIERKFKFVVYQLVFCRKSGYTGNQPVKKILNEDSEKIADILNSISFYRFFFVIWHPSSSQITIWSSFKSENLWAETWVAFQKKMFGNEFGVIWHL